MKQTAHENARSSSVVSFRRSPEYWRRRAEENRKEHRYIEAASLLKSASAQVPNNLDLQAEMARLLQDMGCFELAVKRFAAILGRDPAKGECYGRLAASLEALGLNGPADDALEKYFRALDTMAEMNPGVMSITDLDFHDYGPLPSRREEVLLAQGISALERGKHEKALKKLQRAADISRKPGRLYSLLAYVSLQYNEYEKVVSYGLRALALDPGDITAACSLSDSLWRLGRKRQAVSFLIAAGRSSHSIMGETLIANTIAGKRGLPELRPLWEWRLRQWPHRIPLLHNLAVSYANDGNVEKAMSLWKRIRMIDENDPVAGLCLGLAETGEPLQRLPYSQQLPLEVCLGLVKSVFYTLEDEDEALAARWNRDRRLRDGVLYGLRVEDSLMQGLMLGVLRRLPDALAEPVFTDVFFDLSIDDGAKDKALQILEEKGRPLPSLILRGGRMVPPGPPISWVIPEKPDGESAWRRSFFSQILSDIPFPAYRLRLYQEAAALWPLLPEKVRRQAGNPQQLEWVLGLLLYSLIAGGHSQQAFCLLRRDLPLSPRRVLRRAQAIASILEDKGEFQ